MKTYSVNGTYGRSKNECEVYVYETRHGDKWYVVDGSVNVNLTSDEITDGVDVEELSDIDCFTCSSPINSLEDLELAIERSSRI